MFVQLAHVLHWGLYFSVSISTPFTNSVLPVLSFYPPLRHYVPVYEL
jgi:hypothetical protein